MTKEMWHHCARKEGVLGNNYNRYIKDVRIVLLQHRKTEVVEYAWVWLVIAASSSASRRDPQEQLPETLKQSGEHCG